MNQRYQLTKWIDENKEFAESNTYEATAKHASVFLMFDVSDSSISGAMETLGIKRKTQNKNGYPNDINRFLARHIVELYEALDRPVRPELKNLATR